MQKAAGPTPLGPRKRSRVNYADSPQMRKKMAQANSHMESKDEDKEDSDYSGAKNPGSDSEGEVNQVTVSALVYVPPTGWIRHQTDCVTYI